MTDRFSVVHRPHVELMAIQHGAQPPSSPIDQYCYQIEDSLADGDYVGGPYQSENEAVNACALLNSGVDILYLPNFNRKQLEATGALIIDSGIEVFIGLTRQESERYAALHNGEPEDEFIELDLKHREARTGLKEENS